MGQVAGFAGVTVRTLHHYDKAGLLSPGERSRAGYRLYSDADLARLQQILFYRQLGFSLDEITAIMSDPAANALDHLRERHRRLTEEIGTLHQLVQVAERAMEVQQTGAELSPQERFEVFGDVAFDLSYATDAHLKWGESEGHRQATARAAAHTKEDRRLSLRSWIVCTRTPCRTSATAGPAVRHRGFGTPTGGGIGLAGPARLQSRFRPPAPRLA